MLLFPQVYKKVQKTKGSGGFLGVKVIAQPYEIQTTVYRNFQTYCRDWGILR